MDGWFGGFDGWVGGWFGGWAGWMVLMGELGRWV